MGRGNLYWEKGESVQAASDYREAIRLNPAFQQRVQNAPKRD
jgi:hypothetical protein